MSLRSAVPSMSHMQRPIRRMAKSVRSRFEIVGLVREGAQRTEQLGAGAGGDVLDHGDKDLLLVAELVVDGLAGNAGAAGDGVDARRQRRPAHEDVRRGVENGLALGGLRPLHTGNEWGMWLTSMPGP